MHSRRDQVQAQAYLNGRMVAAVLTADPDAPQSPTRRTTVGLLSGVAVMALIIAGFAVYAWLSPGGAKRLNTPQALLVEKETGARYVLVEGRLRPVLNDASARLLLGEGMKVTMVSRKSSGNLPHGSPLGVIGAPDPLPERSRLTGADWWACADTAPGVDGRLKPSATLVVAAADPASFLTDQQAVLVRAPDGPRHLLWQGRRLKITQDWVVRALGFDSQPPVPVSAAWLGTVPQGPDLTGPDVPRRGQKSAVRVGGTAATVGQIFVVDQPGLGRTRYVALAEGLAALSDVDTALLLADPATKVAYPGQSPYELSLTLSDRAAAASAVMPQPAGRPVTSPARLVWSEPQMLCLAAATGPDGPQPRLLVRNPRATASAPASGPGIRADDRVAHRVAVPSGAGVVVRPLVASGTAGLATYVVTDTGVKYPVPTAQDLAALGYGQVVATPVPPALLDLLPTGPELSVDAAVRGK
ncbi:type VII secretion protein EccB [Actinoplanes sp. NPDC051859]|uniref:type VII secretion protein EccB n=1 Tax=Actinoplanes sp. NPDC051859 TaxID=3363909 RepID=UPI0037AC03B2